MSDHMTFVRPIETADQARDTAIWWTHWIGGQDLSWGEMIEWETFFAVLAARFPELRDEFLENGIIGGDDTVVVEHAYHDERKPWCPICSPFIGVTGPDGERFEVPFSQLAGHSSAKVES